MKKIIFFAFAMACITTMSYAQEIKEIKPFKPSAADAAKIKSLLGKMNKSAYSVEVRNTVVGYGSLKATTVRAGSAVSVTQGLGNSAWVETLLTALIKSTRTVDKEAVVQLQAIAARYQQ
jgi:hypothetical protein